MIAYLKRRRAYVRARRAAELARLQHMIDENRARLAEIERDREAGCRPCAEAVK